MNRLPPKPDWMPQEVYDAINQPPQPLTPAERRRAWQQAEQWVKDIKERKRERN